ncbi:MAG: hypothetical protein H0W44_00165 [Gammaproteobacteria bacterium]|nr:hypothetical protein [Gammaproteobacteria bacterium]
MKILRSTFLLLLCFLVLPFNMLNTAAASSLLQYPLFNLNNNHAQSLDASATGKILLINFFAADCVWCERQFKALNLLQQHCGASVSIAVVGVGAGSINNFRNKLKSHQITLPAYIADKKFLAAIGDVPFTPYSLIFNEHSEYLEKINGYMDAEKLQRLLMQYQPALNCKI